MGKLRDLAKDKFRSFQRRYWDEKVEFDDKANHLYVDQPWLRRQWEQRAKFKPIGKLSVWAISLIAGALILKALGL